VQAVLSSNFFFFGLIIFMIALGRGGSLLRLLLKLVGRFSLSNELGHSHLRVIEVGTRFCELL